MRTIRTLTIFGLCALLTSVTLGQEVMDQWRYTLRRPAAGWRQADFNDADWKQGSGGFGTKGTPGSRVATTWATSSIRLRKSFELKVLPPNPALLIHHDENAEIYINGKNVAELKGFAREYKVVTIPEDKRGAIKAGCNVMAVHSREGPRLCSARPRRVTVV